MPLDHLLATVIANTTGGIIIHCPDIWDVLTSLNEGTVGPFVAKNIPDEYVTERGYTWQRQNKRKYLIWKQNA